MEKRKNNTAAAAAVGGGDVGGDGAAAFLPPLFSVLLARWQISVFPEFVRAVALVCNLLHQFLILLRKFCHLCL